jgi:polysaccharide pyruvyl transferase CsaB
MIFKKIREENAAPKLVLIGNFGAKNFGDELILAGFLKKIGKELPKAKVVVLAGNPRLVRRFHGVDALPQLPTGLRSLLKMNWWRSLRKIREADAVIFPGGGLFNDEESWRAVWIWGWPILIARYFWKPVFLLGQSIGPFGKNWTRKFTKFCLTKTEWVGVRDQASENELKKIGISSKKIKTGKDSAFWLTSHLPKVRKIKKNGLLKILISARDFPKIESKFWNELAQTLDQICKKRPSRIYFAEFGKGDLKIWGKIKKISKNSTNWKILKLPESEEEILREVKKFDLVIGMRLHSLIAARLAGVPAIGLSYSHKVKAFAEKSFEIKDFEKEKLLRILD